MVASRLLIARLLLPLLVVGCDDRSEGLEPLGPSLAKASIGAYELTVLNGTDLGGDVWEITTRPAQLQAHVTFANGDPVTEGTIALQMRVGNHWARVVTAQPDAAGNALFGPGVALPATFRFKYSGQGSGVANGVSNEVTVRVAE